MKAVIPAACFGTRFLPATKAQPKEMLPVYDKPTIQYVIEEAVASGIDDILIVHVKEYFKNQFEDISKEEQAKIQEQHEIDEDYIVYVYDKIKIEQKYIPNGLWEVKNATSGLKFDIDATITQGNETSICNIQLLTGKTGSFDIYYGDNFIKHIVVKSI